jgi:hypothetical protein
MQKKNSIVFFSRLRRLSHEDRQLLMQAIFWLWLAGIAVTMLPFHRVGFLAGRPACLPTPPADRRLAHIKSIRWAISAAAARLPWRALCFQQGLAAQWMLRRRGIPSVLYYGAAQDEQKGLTAHVWVRDGDIDVIGGEIAARFAVLARFPPQDGI